MVALELLSVTGGESHPVPGEPTDIAAQHLICFDPQNPHATTEKQLLIRNSTYVAVSNIIIACSDCTVLFYDLICVTLFC